jgi:hypothetical protein
MPFITQGKTNWKFLLIILILAIIVGSGILWFTAKEKTSSLQLPKKEDISKDSYSFKSFSYENPNEKYPSFSIGIYKNQELVKEIDIKDTIIEPSLFILSPNKGYVAFKAAYAGGTCVYEEFPVVIDLNTFSRVDLNDSDIGKKIGSAFNMDFNEMIKFSAVQTIEDIKWMSNETIRASMKFGDEKLGCAILFYNKPADSSNEIETDVDFTITEGIQQEEPPKITCNDECSTKGQKKCAGNGYQVCGNFDDDVCLEWGSITSCPVNTICQNGDCVQQKCSDGTLYDQCSTTKPFHCENGNLTNKCSICGCPLDQGCQNDGSCCKNNCLQAGLKGCFNNGYQVCGNYESNFCLGWGPVTSCPMGKTCMRGNCIAISSPEPEVEYWAVLTGSSASSILLKDTLREKGWQEDHIKLLTGENTTYANLMIALDWLAVNSDSNDIVLISISTHGTSMGLVFEDKHLNYSELAEKLNRINSNGLGISIHACESDNAIPYLKKEGRVVLLPFAFPDEILKALQGFGDIEGNNDNWVSLEEAFNFLNLYSGANIQDDYPGELNIVFLDSNLRDLDQYNIEKKPLGCLPVGTGRENEISWLAQSFKPNYPILTKVMLDIYRQGNPGPLKVSIRKELSDPDLTSVTLPQNMFDYKENFMCPELYEIDFPNIQVVPGETYYLVIGAPFAVPSAVWEGSVSNNIYNLTHNMNYYPEGKLFTFYNPCSWGHAGTWLPVEKDPYFVGYPIERDLFFATFGKPE